MFNLVVDNLTEDNLQTLLHKFVITATKHMIISTEKDKSMITSKGN